MKELTFILACLILALTLKPCSDGYNAEHQNDTEISMDHNHQDDHDDSCPMLCVCNCCGISVTFQAPPMFVLHSKIDISTEINSEYQSNYRFNFLSNIWQPPRAA